MGDDLTTQNFNRGVQRFCEDFGLLGALASFIWYIGLDRTVAYDRQTLEALEPGNQDFMFVPSKRKISELWSNFAAPQLHQNLSPEEFNQATNTDSDYQSDAPHPDSYQPYQYHSPQPQQYDYSPERLYNSRPYRSASQKLKKKTRKPKKSQSTAKRPNRAKATIARTSTDKKVIPNRYLSASTNNLEGASVGNSGI